MHVSMNINVAIQYDNVQHSINVGIFCDQINLYIFTDVNKN